jgi:hypothetical protein
VFYTLILLILSFFPGNDNGNNLQKPSDYNVIMMKYDAFLKLAPSDSGLYENPFYNIRLANKGIWDPEEGKNLLVSFEIFRRSGSGK